MQTTNREYISKNPIRSTIGAIGVGTVSSIELAVEVIGTARTLNRILNKQLLSMEVELDVELALASKPAKQPKQPKTMAKA